MSGVPAVGRGAGLGVQGFLSVEQIGHVVDPLLFARFVIDPEACPDEFLAQLPAGAFRHVGEGPGQVA